MRLAFKLEDLSTIPRTHVNLGVVVHTCNPSSGALVCGIAKETQPAAPPDLLANRPNLAYSSSSRLEETLTENKNEINNSSGRTHEAASDLHMGVHTCLHLHTCVCLSMYVSTQKERPRAGRCE